MILDTECFEIKGLKKFIIKKYIDNRGEFSEVFLANTKHSELCLNYVQDNESISNFGVFRGMHFQKDNYSQNKLVRVVKGKVIDVICDLRKSSTTFKKIITINLSPNNILFIPCGIAHGFLSLEDDTILNYKSDCYFNPEKEGGFNLFKSNFKNKFPIGVDKIILSDKDKRLPSMDKTYIFNNL